MDVVARAGVGGEGVMQPCERCGYKPSGNSYELNDYCAVCGKTLCANCMEKGCCGHVPARSGEKADFGEDDEVTDEEKGGDR